MLVGGAGDDLLIGGTGADRLVASSGSDILIAGSTAYDFTGFDPAKGYDPNKAAALLAILAEWTNAGESYATRNLAIAGKAGIGHLNGGYFLNAATVSSDTSVDKLTGSSGVDWYFVDNTADIDPIDTVTGNTSGDYWTFIN